MCPFGARRPYAALERMGRGGHHLSTARSRRAKSGNVFRRGAVYGATRRTIPIVIAFFFAQKTFIQGIKLTGLKE
jgi:ABC-type maltose transport system permease subunit